MDGTIEKKESELKDLQARFDRDKGKIEAYKKFAEIKKRMILAKYQEQDNYFKTRWFNSRQN